MEIDNDDDTVAVKQSDLEKRGQDMITPLHAAVYHGRLDVIKRLISSNDYVDPVLRGGKMHGFTPLYLAVQNNHLDCVKFFLNLGASVNPQTEGIYHPIHYAVFNNFVDITRELLQHGADANVRFDNNFFEENPVALERSLWLDHDLPLFHYSILQNYQDMLDVLSSYVDKDSKTSLGKTALMQAVEVNDVKWVEALVTKENVNDRDSFGQPVLHFTMITANRKISKYSKKEFALYPQRLSVIISLAMKHVDINAQFPENESHSTIVHYMVKYGYFEGVLLVLARCTDFNFKNIDLHTYSFGRLTREDITADIKDDNQYLSLIQLYLKHSVYVMIKKAIEFQMIGFPVDENLILKHPYYPWITLEQHTQELNKHKNKIMLQIKYMKENKIGQSNITLWDLLTCREVKKFIKYVSNESVRNFNVLERHLHITHYYSILIKRLGIAKKRKLYLEETTELLFSVLRKYSIPFDCCEHIASYLL